MRPALFFLAMCSASAVAQSGTLVDPTRPPVMGAELAGPAAPRSGPRLQSVLISPNRRVAVIDGAAVRVGGKFGDATVAAITESAVVLKYANRRETLRLITTVEKQERRTTAEAIRDKGTSQ